MLSRFRRCAGLCSLALCVLLLAVWVTSGFVYVDGWWSGDTQLSRLRLFDIGQGVVSFTWNPGGGIGLSSEHLRVTSSTGRPIEDWFGDDLESGGDLEPSDDSTAAAELSIGERFGFRLPMLNLHWGTGRGAAPLWSVLAVTLYVTWALLRRSPAHRTARRPARLRRWGGLSVLVVLLGIWVVGHFYVMAYGNDLDFISCGDGSLYLVSSEPESNEETADGPLTFSIHAAQGGFGLEGLKFSWAAGSCNVCLPFWLLLLVLGLPTAAAWWRWLRWRAPEPPTCSVCNYCLVGNVSGVCPECGATVPTEHGPAASGQIVDHR